MWLLRQLHMMWWRAAMVGGGGWWRQWVVAAVSEGGMETKKHIFVGVSLGAKSQEIAADIGFDVVS